MHRYDPTVKEGILIILVGIIGIYRTVESLPDAGPMITRMLYTLFFVFIAIALIGIKIISDALEIRKERKNITRDTSKIRTIKKP